MDGAQVLETILPQWREAAAPQVGAAWFDAFIGEHRLLLVQKLDRWVEQVRQKKVARAAERAPEAWQPSERADANLAAMAIAVEKEPRDITDEDREALLRYSGWGGLSIEKYQKRFPDAWAPDAFGLIHEYYTPKVLADAIGRAVAPWLEALAGHSRVIEAFEPSVGIGRLVRGVEAAYASKRAPLSWTAVELSPISAAIFERLHPNATLSKTSLEQWITDHGSSYAGRFRLVVANPPYGERGVFALEDKVAEYKEKAAYAYFLRRSLDLLAPRGVGAFLIPAGFLTSARARKLREKVLRRHHLMAAFRLPSRLFPGANLVVDLLFFRARGGELAVVDDDDQFIAAGKYFAEHPSHILGTEVGKPGSGDAAKWRYTIEGEFTGLPAFAERPLCAACIVRPFGFAGGKRRESLVEAPKVDTTGLSEGLLLAVDLGVRVDAFTNALANKPTRALAMHSELLQALKDFVASDFLGEGEGHQNPWRWVALRKLANAGNPGATRFLAAFTEKGALQQWMVDEPVVEPDFRGQPNDIAGQAEELFRQRRELELDPLLEFHARVGGQLTGGEALARLFAANWNVDHARKPGTWLEPLDVYLTGSLWPKLDAVEARLAAGDGDVDQLRKQAERLRGAIGLADFEDIPEITPMAGWISLDLVTSWMGERVRETELELARSGGFVHVAGTEYARTSSLRLPEEAEWLLGWLNHDKTMFSPRTPPAGFRDPDPSARIGDDDDDKLPVAEVRRRWVIRWNELFKGWVEEDDERRELVTTMYNRQVRGHVVPTYRPDPLHIARWSLNIQLLDHQIAGARRVLDQRGGLVAFDVGVGKTYTGLAILARARQDGWAKRPVVLVPNSLAWKWFEDFARVLPDYRVAVIGSVRYQLTRGMRVKKQAERLARGEITQQQYERLITTSRPDSPQDQANKWSAFQAGAYDAVIVTQQAFGRTKLEKDLVRDYVGRIEAIQRSVKLTQRNLAGRDEKKLSERAKAVLKHGVDAWVQEKLELPENTSYLPGITWDNLG
ncbi:MAG: N-6 DNA methylase, partial [Nannocystaceae bacterium]